MSFSEDVLLTKLMAVNETQESIVKISQWILFHRRHADQAAVAWYKYLAQAPENRKLGLFYLANEVVQQSRAKKKDEFVNAFANVFPDAIGESYKHLTPSTQNKLRRLVDVLKQRSIFPPTTIQAIETRLSSGGGPTKKIGNGISGSSLGIPSIPSQLTTLSALQKTESDSSVNADINLKKALNDYSNIFDGETLPAPPVYNSQLSLLITKLNSAEASLNSLLTTRRGLVNELRRLLETNERNLKNTESQLKDLVEKNKHASETKQELAEILVGSTEEQESTTPADSPSAPNVEELTPPATESFTPPAVSYDDAIDDSVAPAYSPNSSDEEDEDDDEPSAKKQKTAIENEPAPTIGTDLEGLDPEVAAFLSNLAPS
ncbi:Rtt103p [Sugiyamaella lignohabitans]|uniref:Rtt103p n=1 Tax=Sugiyamaella lignohabitans TaxID=796027 RepID=A0A170QZH2_9ASCO|nr:Rtt103p [Sugiyamaella lignohabitans]ANB16012.1 Rtt103p [Sugiyamaella lignohabitans]